MLRLSDFMFLTKVLSKGWLINMRTYSTKNFHKNSIKFELIFRSETATNSKGKEKVAPGLIHTYNETMGGVDLGDQLLTVYDPDIRSVKLWKKNSHQSHPYCMR